MAVPTSRAFKECSYKFLTVPVDEFMTTKMYNGDKQTVLKAVQRRDTGATVRGPYTLQSPSNVPSRRGACAQQNTSTNRAARHQWPVRPLNPRITQLHRHPPEYRLMRLTVTRVGSCIYESLSDTGKPYYKYSDNAHTSSENHHQATSSAHVPSVLLLPVLKS